VHETEQIYDEQMAGLVAQLIAIAKANDLPMLLSVGMVLESGPGACTTSIPSGRKKLKGIRNRFGLSLKIIRGDERFDRASGLMITRCHEASEE
jgi:hypothetical protein